MKKTKKALASLAIAGMSLSLIPFNVFAATVPTRIAGVTAEQTAAQIADQTGYTGAAILASSTSYGMVDALTAGPLAASLKAPILLTGAGNTLDAATKAELTKLSVKTVYVTSGTAVIKQGVIDELKGMGIEVVSLGGFDRAETSVNIAKKMTGVTKVAVANTVVDALSIAAVASAANQPILLTDRDALPASVASYLASAGVTSSDVIGGTGVISNAVVAGLPSATRHAGMTAYDTNNQVIQDFAAALAFDNVYVANGVTGIDALAGAPLAAQTKSPIVLTDGKTVPAAAAFTYSKSSASTVVTALGGEFVVPEAVRAGVATGKVTQPGDAQMAIVSVSALDDSNKYLEIVFSKPVTGLQTSDITVKNADTMARYGIKEVQLSSNGLTATVELYAQDDAEEVLEYLQDYVVTVNANGTILTTTFNRPYSLKVRVTDIDVVNEKIGVMIDKGDKEGNEITLNVPDSLDFDYQGALGELVQVWYDGDNDIVKYTVLTKTSVTDAIEISDNDEITLIGADKAYDISSEKFSFYLNGDKINDDEDDADLDNLDGDATSAEDADDTILDEKFNFAKVGFNESGDIEFVSAYTLKDVLVVESVDEDDIVIGVDGNSSGEFDASDATVVKDGKVIAASDLKKGDLLFFNEDADDEDGYAQVISEAAVTGEIEDVYADSIEVDGETYDYIFDGDTVSDFDYVQGTTLYINEDGDIDEVDSDAAESLQAAGDVALYTDYAGNLIYITGDLGDVESNAKYAALTEDMLGYSSARDKVEIEAVTQDEEELSFDISLESLDTITVDGVDYDIDNDSDADSDYEAALVYDSGTGKYTGIELLDNENSDAQVEEISFATDADQGSLVKLHLTDDGDLEELEFFTGATKTVGADVTTSDIEAGDTYTKGYELTDDTLLFDATDGTDADDYVVTKFGDYTGSDIKTGANFIFNEDQEVEAIWFDDTSGSDPVYQEAVVTKVLRNTDDEVNKITAYVAGELKTFDVDDVAGLENTDSSDDSDDLAKGDVVILVFDEDDDTLVIDILTKNNDGSEAEYADQWSDRVTEGLTVDSIDVGNKTVKLSNGKTYTLAGKGLVLDATDTSDITKESISDLDDLKAGETVTVVLDATTGSFAKFFVILD